MASSTLPPASGSKASSQRRPRRAANVQERRGSKGGASGEPTAHQWPPSFALRQPPKEAVMADQTISEMPALPTAPVGRRWPAWRSVVDWALIGAAVGALLWLTVTAWASLTWFVIGLVIYELLLPLINRLARAMPRPL